MTELQKKSIIKMRAEGNGYLAISRVLNLSRDTVRNFCKNKEVQGYGIVAALNIKEQLSKGILCRNCYMPVINKHTGRRRKFCSDKCRYDYHNHQKKGRKANNE